MKTAVKKLLGLGAACFAVIIAIVWIYQAVQIAAYPKLFQKLQGYYDSPSSFPREIPKTASHVRLHHSEGWGQGGSSLQLRYRLPLDQFRPFAVSIMSHWPASSPSAERPYFYTHWRGGPLTPDYVLYVFSDDGSKNHGFAEGIALNAKTCDVVHWQKSW